ncbi:MAG TPA: hypothetical protein VLB84_02895 [Bacteroidia bacterium]|nr:hypothetical protein [Bacteroidia bacterium]
MNIIRISKNRFFVIFFLIAAFGMISCSRLGIENEKVEFLFPKISKDMTALQGNLSSYENIKFLKMQDRWWRYVKNDCALSHAFLSSVDAQNSKCLEKHGAEYAYLLNDLKRYSEIRAGKLSRPQRRIIHRVKTSHGYSERNYPKDLIALEDMLILEYVALKHTLPKREADWFVDGHTNWKKYRADYCAFEQILLGFGGEAEKVASLKRAEPCYFSLTEKRLNHIYIFKDHFYDDSNLKITGSALEKLFAIVEMADQSDFDGDACRSFVMKKIAMLIRDANDEGGYEKYRIPEYSDKLKFSSSFKDSNTPWFIASKFTVLKNKNESFDVVNSIVLSEGPINIGRLENSILIATGKVKVASIDGSIVISKHTVSVGSEWMDYSSPNFILPLELYPKSHRSIGKSRSNISNYGSSKAQ